MQFLSCPQVGAIKDLCELVFNQPEGESVILLGLLLQGSEAFVIQDSEPK